LDSRQGDSDKDTLWHDDPMLPVYALGKRKGITTDAAVKLLLNTSINKDRVAKAVPTSVSKNALFVVDLKAPHVQNLKALLADDLGVWKGTGTKTFYYKTGSRQSPIKVPESMREDTGVYRCTRSFYRNIARKSC